VSAAGPTLGIVIPVYGKFEYVLRAARSALENTKTFVPYLVIVDDASPERLHRDIHHPDDPYGNYLFNLRYLREEFGESRVIQIECAENGGLTRAWNIGLRVAANRSGFETMLGRPFDACCVTNSDVVFPSDWDAFVFQALTFAGYSLVGPVTNAPGTNKEQYVANYSAIYDRAKKDDATHMFEVQRELLHAQGARYKQTTLNGFCMVAYTRTWWDNAYDPEYVFRPRNDFNSKGEPNPTPLMTLNEYELQARWHGAGLKTAACLGSYVYHYRAVTRGDKHKRGDWARLPPPRGGTLARSTDPLRP